MMIFDEELIIVQLLAFVHSLLINLIRVVMGDDAETEFKLEHVLL